MERDLERYATDYLADYGFERWQVQYRRAALLQNVADRFAGAVLEVGCGIEPLFAHAPPVQEWHVIEPARAFADHARHVAAAQPHAQRQVNVHEGFLEDSVDQLRRACPAGFDLVIASALIQEIPDPVRLLASLAAVLRPGGWLYLDASNAGSLHRRMAVAMGLLERLDTPSARAVRMQGRAVYDLPHLVHEVEEAGFRVERTGGILLKPFEHARMERALDTGVIEPAHLDAFARLGEQYPDLASEIWVLATRA